MPARPVYGGNTKMPFSIDDCGGKAQLLLMPPPSAADELIGYTLCPSLQDSRHRPALLHGYGPWGRPDMAASFSPARYIAGEADQSFNRGEMWRDFTFIDDIVNGVVRAMDRPPLQTTRTGTPPHPVYNLGNNKTEKLTDFIATIEQALQRKAKVRLAPIQPGDVPSTSAISKQAAAMWGSSPPRQSPRGIPIYRLCIRTYYGVLKP